MHSAHFGPSRTTRSARGRVSAAAGGLVFLIGFQLCGCDGASEPPRYVAQHGVVSAVRPEAGEMEVRLSPDSAAAGASGRAIEECIVNEHSEVYLDDALLTLGALRRGDEIEMVGYRDPSLRNEKFVISFAYCKRP